MNTPGFTAELSFGKVQGAYRAALRGEALSGRQVFSLAAIGRTGLGGSFGGVFASPSFACRSESGICSCVGTKDCQVMKNSGRCAKDLDCTTIVGGAQVCSCIWR